MKLKVFDANIEYSLSSYGSNENVSDEDYAPTEMTPEDNIF